MDGNVMASMILKGRVVDVPRIDGTLTKSGQAADAKTVGEKLTELRDAMLDGDDVVNDLETEDERKPLSAAMGKSLNDRINQVGGGSADSVTYDNSESNLDAHDVQYAITLLASMVRGCLPLEGGTITGEDVYMDGGNVRIQGNENALWIQSLSASMDNNNRRLLALYNGEYMPDKKDAVLFEDIANGTKTSYALYGQHNMRKGFYSGKGSARTVQTMSVGSAVFVTSKASYGEAAIVTDHGVVLIKSTGITFGGTDVAWFENGVLTLGGAALNASGVTYYYYAI